MRGAEAVELLRALVKVPSPSREEAETAGLLERWLAGRGIEGVRRSGNNVWVRNRHYDRRKPTVLLCSHHDTVRPTSAWTRDPYDGALEGGKVWGLGSNDAGASVVAMAAAFEHFYEAEGLGRNLVLALVAEEEISGAGGVRSILGELGELEFAVVGEPTGMRMAVAEKGLMVLDCVAKGRAGHAARDEGDNAIYRAISDIEWIRGHKFERVSELFGEVKASVTMIEAGTAHNVVPAECRFVVDVRVTEKYTNEEVLEEIRAGVGSEVVPRSMHLRPSSISVEHPVVVAGRELGMETFGSPTTSDQVALDIPSVKVGPGKSERSHGADEYVEVAEVVQGVEMYIKLLEKIL